MKKKLLFFFVFGLLLGCGRVGAYEYTSGGISYKQVGTDSYLVTLTLIYTCSTVSPPSTNIIDVGSKTKKTTITVKRISKIDVTPTCRSQCKKCNSSSSCSYPYGYLKYSYQGLFIASYFPKKDCDLTLSYNECCRSGAITTGGQSGGVYIESKLNQCLRKSNSSPSSNEISALLFYKDQCITQPLNFTEIDGDSLVYLLAKPLNSVGTPLPYSSPYKFSLPIKFSSWPKANTSWFPPNCEGFHLDTFTGLLQFKPTKTDYSVFAVRVEEWRDTSKMGTGKKVKIGDITKDYSIIILNYITNNVPIISGINITPFTDYFVKAGDTAKFTLTTYDADKKDSVTLVMDSSKTSAKFTTFGLPHPTGKFVWATKKSFASKKPYIFNFHAKDSACPITGYAARTINVYVLDSASLPVYKLTDTSKGCGDHTLIMKSSNPIVPTLFTWIINNKDTFYGDSVLRYHFPKTGTYTIHAIGNNYFPFVIKHYYDTINIPYLFKADCGKDTTICFGDSFKINAIGGKYSYWLPSFGMSSSTILQPIFKPTFDTKYTLYSSDSIGCKDTDDIIIRVSKPTLNLYSKSIKLCGGDSSQINISYISQIKWVPKNGIVFYLRRCALIAMVLTALW
ncbi:MAG: hypothetical protein NTX03_08055 [Bacteroidetes bacterium]|nr:hypothetical protein [Bacteroidota bacterium]